MSLLNGVRKSQVFHVDHFFTVMRLSALIYGVIPIYAHCFCYDQRLGHYSVQQ